MKQTVSRSFALFGPLFAVIGIAALAVVAVYSRSEASYSRVINCYTFTRNIGVGSLLSEDEANTLNEVFISQRVVGPEQKFGRTYDEIYAAAMVRFQKDNGLTPSGYFGPSTRELVNSIYGCWGNAYPTIKPTPLSSAAIQSPTPTQTQSPTPSFSPTPSPEPSFAPSPSPTPSPTPSTFPTPSASPTPTPSPVTSLKPSASPTPSPKPTLSPTPTPKINVRLVESPTMTPSVLLEMSGSNIIYSPSGPTYPASLTGVITLEMEAKAGELYRPQADDFKIDFVDAVSLKTITVEPVAFTYPRVQSVKEGEKYTVTIGASIYSDNSLLPEGPKVFYMRLSSVGYNIGGVRVEKGNMEGMETGLSALIRIPDELTSLKAGDQGAEVLSLQKILVDLGYLDKKYMTGTFGPKTEEAVRKYESAVSPLQAI